MTPLLSVVTCISLGFVLGVVFFWLLKINSELYLRSNKAWFGVLSHIARLAVLILIFAYIASFGALALLSSFGGFLIGRIVFIRYILGDET